MSGGSEPGLVLVGIFMLVAGICLTLVGGGCTLFLAVNIFDLFRGDGGLGLLLLGASLLTLAVGLLLIRGGARLMAPNE
jgi:hypothetical protein